MQWIAIIGNPGVAKLPQKKTPIVTYHPFEGPFSYTLLSLQTLARTVINLFIIIYILYIHHINFCYQYDLTAVQDPFGAGVDQ